ncbi:MAG: single-stranded DNA-binding protein [Actinomycetota bacterium]
MAVAEKSVKAKKATPQNVEEDFSLNELLLRGRVSGVPTEKELPSGDRVVEFRIVVSRASREGVDTLDIGAWSAKSRKKGLSLKENEWIEISGSVHRRFWQGAQGVASRWQIEAIDISRI